MSNKEQNDVVEFTMPTFLVPVIAVVLIGLVIFVIMSLSGKEKVEDTKTTDRTAFSDPGIVKASLDINVDEGAYIGVLEDAKYAIVEFSDYQCPYCEKHASETLPSVESDFIGNEDVVYFFREVALYPPESMTLSILGQCIFENEDINAYLAYRNLAYSLTFENDADLLDKAKIENAEVRACLEERVYEDRINNNQVLSQNAGAQGVPGFVFGELSEDGKIEGYLIPGAYPFSMFEEVLDALKK